MGNYFTKAKQLANNYNNREYQDDNQTQLSGIQYSHGIVIQDDNGEDIFILSEGFKDVAFSLHYESKIFKLGRNVSFEVSFSHQLRLETYQAIFEWGESEHSTDEITVLTFDPDKYPIASDYYDDSSVRAIFVRKTNNEGAKVDEDTVHKAKALLAKYKR